ncbi:MAG: DNA mismatch repair endonuclease MutL [Bacteroidales bacterium]|nr:DNA mismatch repair endonuclease MutL [Bacteroidales bacterium]
MSDIIRLLPDSVANQIAAGEVIQRPSAVVKELVENAVDAGAGHIQIFIQDAGRTLIQVIDDGKGMSPTDARMAFERHATSKIRKADDLFALNTMGFRGEALPSICAISQVELKTQAKGDTIGTELTISASKVESQTAWVNSTSGSSFSVRNLFFNAPARRKFMKSDNVERSNIMKEFERLALVNNNLRLSLTMDGKVIDLMPGSFKQRISDLWKNDRKLHLMPVDVDTSLVKITGFVGRPESARKYSPLQFLFVNGRNFRHPYFHKAVMSCFEKLIAPGTHPSYFLKFEVDPASVDVNISPTKNEIKFEYEQQIWPILVATIRSALGKYAAVPSIDFSSDLVPAATLQEGEVPKAPSIDMPEGYNPFEGATDSFGGVAGGGGETPERTVRRHSSMSNYHSRRVSSNWEKLYSGFMNGTENDGGDGSIPNTSPEQQPLPGLEENMGDCGIGPLCLQYALKYIITPTREGLLLIDQHRAHVRILYERFLKEVGKMEKLTQHLMFPEVLVLDGVQQAALAIVEDELAKFGFLIEYDEENKWRITGVPVMLRKETYSDIVLSILESVSETSENYGKDLKVSPEALMEKVALSMARSAAMVRGRKLSAAEMEQLTGELFSLPDSSVTPDGKRIYAVMSEEHISALIH